MIKGIRDNLSPKRRGPLQEALNALGNNYKLGSLLVVTNDFHPSTKPDSWQQQYRDEGRVIATVPFSKRRFEIDTEFVRKELLQDMPKGKDAMSAREGFARTSPRVLRRNQSQEPR